jgi:hypothetical protein
MDRKKVICIFFKTETSLVAALTPQKQNFFCVLPFGLESNAGATGGVFRFLHYCLCMAPLTINIGERHQAMAGTAILPGKNFLHAVWHRVFLDPEKFRMA